MPKVVIIDSVAVLFNTKDACLTAHVHHYTELCDKPDAHIAEAPDVAYELSINPEAAAFLRWCRWQGAPVILVEQYLDFTTIWELLRFYNMFDSIDRICRSMQEAMDVAEHTYNAAQEDIQVFTTRPDDQNHLLVENGCAVLDGYTYTPQEEVPLDD